MTSRADSTEPRDADLVAEAPLPAPEREAALWARLNAHGDAHARAALIEMHRAFARVVAATYFGRRIDDDIDFDEYHQWALLGMIESVDRFDAARGVGFRTFASRRMHGCILDGLEHATEKQQQIAVRRRLREERAADALQAARAGRGGIGAAIDEGELFAVLAEVGMGLALGMLLEDTAMVEPARDAVVPDRAYDHAELRQLQGAVHASIGKLSEQEQLVVRGHYLDDLRFVEIADKLGLTKGRVSQIHKQAMDKLRATLGTANSLDLIL